jgi:hypothetical protein
MSLAIGRTSGVLSLLLASQGAHAQTFIPFQEIYQTTTTGTAGPGSGAMTTADASCDVGWTASGSNCYKLTSETAYYVNSVAECEGLGATPFTPESDDENAFLVSLLNADPAAVAWVGICYVETPTPHWEKYDGSTPTYFPPLFFSFSPTGMCLYVLESNSAWVPGNPGIVTNSKMACVEAAATGGDFQPPQPPASVNSGGGGSLAVPFSGELLFYHQFLDTSTGAESAYKYPTLSFVEADEDIHRADLVRILPSPSTLYLSLTSMCVRLLSKAALSSVFSPRPTLLFLKAKSTISPENTAPGLLNKS